MGWISVLEVLVLFFLNQSIFFDFLIISFGTKNLFIPGNTSISLQDDAPCNMAQMFLMQLSARALRPKWRIPHRHSEDVGLRDCQISQVSWWLQAMALMLERTEIKFQIYLLLIE